MERTGHKDLLTKLAKEYSRYAPKSAALNKRATQVQVDGGSHAMRLLEPFPPRIVVAEGAWLRDEDGHDILDFWQGHHANVLGHNPKVVTSALAAAFETRFGLLTGFADRLQVEVAEILCQQTGAERVRFTTSGSLATMYAVLLAKAFTQRRLVMKVGGGWHGAQPWGLKGVSFCAARGTGFQGVESEGLPQAIPDEVLVTRFNDTTMLRDDFRQHGDQVACFIVEPFIGAGGFMAASREYLQTARQLTLHYGALLVFDEVVSGFRFRAGDATPYHFVGSLVPTQHLDLLAIPRERFWSLAQDGLPGVSAYLATKKVFGRKRTVVVTYNENLFVAQSKTLLREIGKRQQRFRELVIRLEGWRRGEIRRGRAPTLVAIQKKINDWLKARHMKDLFAVKVTERDGLPAITYQFNHGAWEELQATLLGKTILFTDNDDWTDAQIVHAYRASHHIENAFREMKDPHHIALRPQYHWTDQKVRVHVFICVLALMLVSLLQRELHMKGIDLSMRRMLELLGDIRELVMIFPPQVRGGKAAIRTTITVMSPEQRELYEVLALNRYASR